MALGTIFLIFSQIEKKKKNHKNLASVNANTFLNFSNIKRLIHYKNLKWEDNHDISLSRTYSTILLILIQEHLAH